MRAGYAARGAVYLLVGALAIFAAVNGGEAEGSTGALEYLIRQPFGVILLSFIAFGLYSYTVWRFTDAILDLDGEGGDVRGRAARAGQFLSGFTHAFLGSSAVAIIVKGASGGDESAENWTAAVMAQPFGRWLVAIAGAVVLSVGVYLFIKSWRQSYREQIHSTDATRRLAPLIRFGLFSHGFVLLIIGGLIVYAAWTTNPSHAAGLGEALRILETQMFGRMLLGLAGAGMIGFSVYCFVQARYRVAPRLSASQAAVLAAIGR